MAGKENREIKNSVFVDLFYEDVQQTPKGHVFVDRRLMLAEYDHFSSCVKRNIVLKIHIDRIVYTESPNLRSFRQRLIMDCIKKRDLIRFC